MFRRTSIPNLEFNVASSTQAEAFSPPTLNSSFSISYDHEEEIQSNAEVALGKSSDGEVVQIAFSSTPVKKQSFNLIYRF